MTGKNLSPTLLKEQVIVALTLTVVLTAGFYSTDLYMASQSLHGKAFWKPAISLDAAIPFKAGWIWIYLLYFPICVLPIVCKKLWSDIETFRRVVAGFIIQFGVSISLFWLFPSQMDRPLIEPDGLSVRATLWFFEVDPGYNVFPSLHVANVAFVACMAWRLSGPLLGGLIWIACALITVSTVMVKQHYLVDLPAGFFLGVFSYFAAFSNAFNFLKSSKPHPQHPA